MKIISYFSKINFIFFILIPVFLITGPAIPDIIISFCFLYFIVLNFLILKKYSMLKENLILVSLCFWILLIFISFFSYNKQASFQDSIIFIRFLFIPIIGYFFIFNYKKNIEITTKIIFFTVCFVLIDTIFQFWNYTSESGFGGDLFGFKSNWYGRLTGPFKNELVPGSFVSKFGLIGLIFLIIQKNNFKNYLLLIYLTSIGIVCFASGERMSLATYLLGLLVLILFLKNFRFLIFISLILICISNYVIYKFHPSYNDFKIIESSHHHLGLVVEKSFTCKNDISKTCTKTVKLQPTFIEIIKNFKSTAYGEIYNLAFNMFKNNPMTGIGINNYKFVCENYKNYNKKMKNYNCASHPHNIYMQWLAEGGIIVFMMFIVYLGYLVNFILNRTENRDLKIISLANIIILFWPIMSTGSLIKNWNGVLTFFIISICVSIHKIKKDNLK